MVKKISQKEFDEVKKDNIAVIDFSAEWCGPCRMLAPVMEQVSEELQGKAAFYNIDVDENPDLAEQFSIMNIPALIVLSNGNKIASQVGFQPKENIVKFIEQYLK